MSEATERPFALRPGAAGPGLASGLAALTNVLGMNAVTRALGRGLRPGSQLPVLEVGTASRIRDAAYLLWDGASLGGDPAIASLAAAAHTEHVFWGRDDFEPYRALTAELPSALPGAVPDERRPWVVVEGPSLDDARVRLADEGLGDAQLHVFAPRSLRSVGLDRTVVRWTDLATTVAAVLGRSSLVLAHDGSLLEDAVRLGKRAIRVGAPLPNARARLVATLPPVLLDDETFVRELVHRGPGGFASLLADLDYRRARIEASIVRTTVDERLVVMQRRIRKFREEPDRFFAESRFPLVRSGGDVVRRLRRRP